MSLNSDDLYKIDYRLTMTVNTLVTAFGMLSENLQRLQRGESIAYPVEAFEELSNRNGTHHNAAVSWWKH